MHRLHLVSFIVFTFAVRSDDEILDLPGLSSKPSFRQYSGYISIFQSNNFRFVESASNPASDPLILWLNGGPGCSSLGGLLYENGPFHVIPGTVKLYFNVYSWNKVANVLYLESPAGVGFSYSTDKNYTTNDDQVSLENYAALKHFFTKFPQFRNNDFYITGESYGGIYVPTLAVRVLNGAAKINLKGFAIGNGVTNSRLLTNSLFFFAYFHGLFGKTSWNKLAKYCCKGGVSSQETCNFFDKLSHDCELAIADALTVILADGQLNPYNIYDICNDSDSSQPFKIDMTSLFPNHTFRMHFGNTTASIPCLNDVDYTRYLKQNSVRKALHVPNHVHNWTLCSADVSEHYKKIYDDMSPQYKTLLGKVRGLVYNGDVDLVCSFLGDQWFVDDLKRKVLNDYKYWKIGSQVGGFVKQFDHLDFVTIKGSGHMVPADKPKEALQMITNFLKQKPYGHDIYG